jgi:hypothetical protein
MPVISGVPLAVGCQAVMLAVDAVSAEPVS